MTLLNSLVNFSNEFFDFSMYKDMPSVKNDSFMASFLILFLFLELLHWLGPLVKN